MHRSSGLADLDNWLWVVRFIVLPLLLEQTRKVVCPMLLNVVWPAVLLQQYFCVVCGSHSVTCLNAYNVAVTLSYSLIGEVTALLRQLFWS